MSKRLSLLAAFISVSVCAFAASADISYSIDNNCANFEPIGDAPGYQAFINVFTTDPSNPTVTQLSVAWAGLPVGANVQIVLYSLSDSMTTEPIPTRSLWVANTVNPTSYLTPLQVVSDTITSGKRNDDSGEYPPGGINGAVMTTYTIPATTITTGRFAVGAIAYEDNVSYGCVWSDDTVTAVNDVLIAVGPTSGLNADLSNVTGGGASPNYDMWNMNGFTFGGLQPPLPPSVTDPSYLIRAGGVPLTWTGGAGADTSWGTDANWNGGASPAANPNLAVTFDFTTVSNPVVNMEASHSISAVTLNGPGTLTVNSTGASALIVTGSGGITVGTGQTLNGNGNINAGSGGFAVNGGTVGGALNLTGNVVSTGGQFTPGGATTMNITGNLTLDHASARFIHPPDLFF